MMKAIFTAILVPLSVSAALAQSMGPHQGPVCRGPGPVYIKPTPACGAAPLHAGLFREGRYQRIYQSTVGGCIPREVFLGCL